MKPSPEQAEEWAKKLGIDPPRPTETIDAFTNRVIETLVNRAPQAPISLEPTEKIGISEQVSVKLIKPGA